MSYNTFGHIYRTTTWGESHGPALGAVSQVGRHDLAHNLRLYGVVCDLHQRFNTSVEIAPHPIGRRNIDLAFFVRNFVTTPENNNAAMFQKSSND